MCMLALLVGRRFEAVRVCRLASLLAPRLMEGLACMPALQMVLVFVVARVCMGASALVWLALHLDLWLRFGWAFLF